MKGNLLVRREAFVWNDQALNRNTDIANFNDAIVSARDVKDDVYSPPNLYDFGQDIIFEFLWTEGKDHTSFQIKYAWITADQFQTLASLHYTLGGSTPGNAQTFQDLDNELYKPNSLIGFNDAGCSDPLVYDKKSWKQFHERYAVSLSFDEQCEHYQYFKKHYKPDLRVPAQTIRNSINAHVVDAQIIRLDVPPQNEGEPVFGQQTHIHFGGDNPCALNIDGTWKHPNASFRMSNASKRTLSSWGFMLPESCYL